MIDRESIQRESVNLLTKHDKILLEFATGVGKTLAFILIQESVKNSKVLVVIAERLHKNNWINEYKKHNKEQLLENVEFTCYSSLHKYVNNTYDFICLDEVHRVTPIRLESLKQIKCKYIIGLSATIAIKPSRLLLNYLGTFYRYKIPLKMAIENKLVPEPAFYLYGVNLDNRIPNQIIEITKGKKAIAIKLNCAYKDYKRWLFNSKYPNLLLRVLCTQEQAIAYYEETIQYYKEVAINNPSKSWVGFKLNRLGLDRKNYIASIKTHKVKEFLKKFNKKYICFCNDISQIEALTTPEYSIHSKKKDNDFILSQFNAGEINKIYVAKMMQEGMNLEGIEASIIVQLDSTSRTFIQKTGRSLRSLGIPEIYLFYVKGTSDEVYLQKALEEIDKNLIHYM